MTYPILNFFSNRYVINFQSLSNIIDSACSIFNLVQSFGRV